MGTGSDADRFDQLTRASGTAGPSCDAASDVTFADAPEHANR